MKPQPVKPVSGTQVMLRILIAGLFLHYSSSIFSQKNNLVVNPSFEERLDFQSKATESNWTKCLRNDTPDYIEFGSRGEPDFYYKKYIGGLLPIDGNAYAGIFCYRINPLRGIDNVREFIQAPLMESLQKDTIYDVSLYIALDPESNTAINNFNIYFYSGPVHLNKENQMFELRPQIRFKDTMLDSLTWLRLETTYKAKGHESQIILGNFSPDNSIRKSHVYHKCSMEQKWNLHELERASYYYIDMVSVSKASETYETPDESQFADKQLNQSGQIPRFNPTIPEIEIGTIRRDSSIVLNNIYFEFDKSELLPESYAVLDKLNTQLLHFEEIFITIEGHTDNMGTFEYNIRLSQERAEAVTEYLINNGLRSDRISSEGFGYTKPLSDNRTEAGRILNRRVAFRISNSNALK